MVANIFVAVYVELVAPLILPNEILSVELCHWYDVVPVPFETVAVKVVEDPAQIVTGVVEIVGKELTVTVAVPVMEVPVQFASLRAVTV